MSMNRRKMTLFEMVTEREAKGNLMSDHPKNTLTEAIYSSLSCTYTLEGHTGCVNALDWNDEGQLLASGSDDRHIAIWSIDNMNYSSNGNSMNPHSIQPVSYQDTGCRGNIFGLKFLPSTSNQIVSVAADGSCRLFQLGNDGKLSNLHTWNEHSDRVKRVDADNQNISVFVTASEDGTVRQFDCRDGYKPGKVLGNLGREHEITSLSIAPMKPNIIAFGGLGLPIRIIDRRNYSSSKMNYRHFWIPDGLHHYPHICTSVKFSSFSMELIASYLPTSRLVSIDLDAVERGVYSTGFEVGHDIETNVYTNLNNFWTALEALKNGRQVILPFPDMRLRNLRDLPKDVVEKILCEKCFEELLHLIMDLRKLQAWHCRILGQILSYTIFNLFLVAKRIKQLHRVTKFCMEITQFYAVNRIYLDKHDPNFPTILPSFFCFSILARIDSGQYEMDLEVDYKFTDVDMILNEPMIEMLKRQYEEMKPIDVLQTLAWRKYKEQKKAITAHQRIYSGHRNQETTKDINFLGPNHEFVASGSDNGCLYLWNKEGKKIFVGKSDNSVVNCMVESPLSPLIAVSGIDTTIKIWEPSSSESHSNSEWKKIDIEGLSDTEEAFNRMGSTFEGSNYTMINCPVQ